jgi:hypothetical protein
VKAYAMLMAYVDCIFLMQSCLLHKLFRGSTPQYWCCYSEVIDNALWKLETAGFECKWPTWSVHTYIRYLSVSQMSISRVWCRSSFHCVQRIAGCGRTYKMLVVRTKMNAIRKLSAQPSQSVTGDIALVTTQHARTAALSSFS